MRRPPVPSGSTFSRLPSPEAIVRMDHGAHGSSAAAEPGSAKAAAAPATASRNASFLTRQASLWPWRAINRACDSGARRRWRWWWRSGSPRSGCCRRLRPMNAQSRSEAVLITGCSSGIGRATAERLAKNGHRVYATARRVDSISDLEAAGCRLLALDVTDEPSMSAAVQQVEQEEGAVGVLVNNAGYSQSG